MTYESNIEGCLEDIVNVLKSKYDEFSDFSESDDDEIISKITKTEYFKGKKQTLENDALILS